MNVRIRFLGHTATIAGTNDASMDLSDGLTVKQILGIIDEKYLGQRLLNQDGKIRYPCLVLVNGKPIGNRLVDLYERLKGEVKVDFLQMYAGG